LNSIFLRRGRVLEEPPENSSLWLTARAERSDSSGAIGQRPIVAKSAYRKVSRPSHPGRKRRLPASGFHAM